MHPIALQIHILCFYIFESSYHHLAENARINYVPNRNKSRTNPCGERKYVSVITLAGTRSVPSRKIYNSWQKHAEFPHPFAGGSWMQLPRFNFNLCTVRQPNEKHAGNRLSNRSLVADSMAVPTIKQWTCGLQFADTRSWMNGAGNRRVSTSVCSRPTII